MDIYFLDKSRMHMPAAIAGLTYERQSDQKSNAGDKSRRDITLEANCVPDYQLA